MYDKVGLTTLPITGAGLATNSLTVALVGMALVAMGMAAHRLAPRFARNKS